MEADQAIRILQDKGMKIWRLNSKLGVRYLIQNGGRDLQITEAELLYLGRTNQLSWNGVEEIVRL